MYLPTIQLFRFWCPMVFSIDCNVNFARYISTRTYLHILLLRFWDISIWMSRVFDEHFTYFWTRLDESFLRKMLIFLWPNKYFLNEISFTLWKHTLIERRYHFSFEKNSVVASKKHCMHLIKNHVPWFQCVNESIFIQNEAFESNKWNHFIMVNTVAKRTKCAGKWQHIKSGIPSESYILT